MKITKELIDNVFEKHGIKLYNMNSYGRNLAILSNITKKEAFGDNFNLENCISDDVLIKVKEIYLEKFEEFRKSNLQEYEFYEESFRNNSTGMYLGNDILLSTEPIWGDNNMTKLGLVYCTRDSINEAKRINKKYDDFLREFKEKYTNNFLFRNVYILDINIEKKLSINSISIIDCLNIEPENIFNDDLDNTRILNLLKQDRGGFFIFHGEPGCGKSTYIKYLISTLSEDISFIIVPQEIFLGYPQLFREYIIKRARDRKKSILILEDCEKIITSREKNGTNTTVLSEILNMTDGILGDFMKTKFICTFNCDLVKIDKALLRKGRLLMKYEFNKLSGQKLIDLCKQQNISNPNLSGMTLADIFNYNEDNGFTIQERNRIGF